MVQLLHKHLLYPPLLFAPVIASVIRNFPRRMIDIKLNYCLALHEQIHVDVT